MSPEQNEKLNRLRELLRASGGCAVAYSGGVDSTFLMAAANEVLGNRALAVIATSSTYPRRERESALKWLEDSGIQYEVIESEELDIPGFAENPTNRCYYCKKELFQKVRSVADRHGIPSIADGTNLDDTGDHRPGMRASSELRVLSPLLECRLTKADIRILSKEVYNLPTFNKQPMACMSSRFPYGTKITRQKLEKIETIEDFLYEEGFATFRARYHDDILRLELDNDGIKKATEDKMRAKIINKAKSVGFVYITIDLEGFRSGSMNEGLVK